MRCGSKRGEGGGGREKVEKNLSDSRERSIDREGDEKTSSSFHPRAGKRERERTGRHRFAVWSIRAKKEGRGELDARPKLAFAQDTRSNYYRRSFDYNNRTRRGRLNVIHQTAFVWISWSTDAVRRRRRRGRRLPRLE